METNNNFNPQVNNEREIDLSELFSVLWDGKWLVVGITTIFSIAAVIYSLSLPNVYQSRALLSPVGDSGGGGLSQVMKNYGGLASLAGVNLSSTDAGSNSVKALEKLNTLSFFENNIMPNIFLPDLMALDYWDASSNKVVYDNSIFDESSQKWVRDFAYPQTQIPSPQESFNVFVGHLQASKDIDTGFVSISVKHESPYVAQEWTALIIDQLNYFFRAKDKLEAQAAMDYLNIQMAQTSFAEIKLVIAQLLQQKMQQLALVEANNFYVFDYIDPPAVMETKSEPIRSLICIIGALLGGIIGCLVVIIRFFASNQKS